MFSYAVTATLAVCHVYWFLVHVILHVLFRCIQAALRLVWRALCETHMFYSHVLCNRTVPFRTAKQSIGVCPDEETLSRRRLTNWSNN